jgi:hypothetical protein
MLAEVKYALSDITEEKGSPANSIQISESYIYCDNAQSNIIHPYDSNLLTSALMSSRLHNRTMADSVSSAP